MTTKRWYTVRDLEKRFGPMTLGFFIKAFRECDEISQTEYAKKLGISKANLCDIENNRKSVSPSRAAKIADKIGVSRVVLIQLAIQDSLNEAKLNYKVKIEAA